MNSSVLMRGAAPLRFALFAMVAAACRSGGGAPGTGPAVAPNASRPELLVPMRAVTDDAFLLADNANVFADTARRVIRDTIEWKSTWRQAVSRQGAPPARPAVDFSKELVVLAAGGRMKPGDVIHVDSVGTRGNLTVIVIRTTKACQTSASNAFPFELARIPKTDATIQFREHVMKSPGCQ
jgi:hypothetical protein